MFSRHHFIRNSRTQSRVEHVFKTFFLIRFFQNLESLLMLFHCFFLGLRHISVKLSHLELLGYRPGATKIRCALLLIRFKIRHLRQICFEIRNNQYLRRFVFNFIISGAFLKLIRRNQSVRVDLRSMQHISILKLYFINNNL